MLNEVDDLEAREHRLRSRLWRQNLKLIKDRRGAGYMVSDRSRNAIVFRGTADWADLDSVEAWAAQP